MQPTVQELLSSAQEIKQEILADRRTIHQNPEVGTHHPATKAYVTKRLIELGYKPQELCESGIVATITGKDTGRCMLLRADMDALRIQEQTGLPFLS